MRGRFAGASRSLMPRGGACSTNFHRSSANVRPVFCSNSRARSSRPLPRRRATSIPLQGPEHRAARTPCSARQRSARPADASVESRGVGSLKPFHPRNEVAGRCLTSRSLPMVVHDHIAVNDKAAFLAHLPKRRQKALPVTVIQEDLLPSVPTT